MATVGRAFSVYLDEDDLLDPFERHKQSPPSPVPAEESLISCSFVREINGSGSCSFAIPPTHPLYANINLGAEISIAEIDNIVWIGNVVSVSLDWDLVKKVECEGYNAILAADLILYDVRDPLFKPENMKSFISAYFSRDITLLADPDPRNDWRTTVDLEDDETTHPIVAFKTDPIGKTKLQLLQEFQDYAGGFYYFRT